MSSEKFEIGDLVIFEGSAVSVVKNSIGVVIGIAAPTELLDDYFIKEDWYIVQFGTMKLIVSNNMVSKISGNESP